MKVNEWKQGQWVPVEIAIGSNIRGRRFQYGSASIDPQELNRILTPHPECLQRLQSWLDTLRFCYEGNGEETK